MLEPACTVDRKVSKKAWPLSALQVDSWHVKTNILMSILSSATELCKLFFFFFPVKNTKVLLLLQNRQFSKILTLFSEVSFSRIQIPNSRPWDLPKTTQISILSLCLYHTLHTQIYANNFLFKTHFWYTGNWSWKKEFAPSAETSFTLRVPIALHRTI